MQEDNFQQFEEEPPSFVQPAMTYGAAFAIAASLVFYGTLVAAMSGAEPGILPFIIACLGCLGIIFLPGVFSVKSFLKQTANKLQVGKGAVIGVVSGAAFGVMYGFMDLVWLLFGVETSTLVMEYTLALTETFGGDTGQVDEMRDVMEEQARTGGSIMLGVLFNILIYGILNMLSGMLAVSIWADKTSDEF